MNKKIIFFLVFAGPLLGLTLAVIHLSVILFSPYSGPSSSFTVHPGEGFAKVNYRLHQKELISNPRIFHYYAKLTNSMEQLKAGNYLIEKGMNMPAILSLLTSTTGSLISVTIPEGKNIYQVAQILDQHNIIKQEDFLKEAKQGRYHQLIGSKVESVEGYLYPETYRFAPNSSAPLIISTMIKQFHKATKSLDLNQTKYTPHEIVILASIIEKETGASWERSRISGVFHNRLQKRMRLQSDPTTIYGIYEKFDGNLTKKHLLTKTAYNTYKIAGLPKGPICNPGFEAIKAALMPEEHSYLYFVSRNDGTHVFSPTYKEHQKAVDHFQKNPASREGKSWRDLDQSKRP